MENATNGEGEGGRRKGFHLGVFKKFIQKKWTKMAHRT